MLRAVGISLRLMVGAGRRLKKRKSGPAKAVPENKLIRVPRSGGHKR